MSCYPFWVFSGDKTLRGFLATSGCLLSMKVWWLSKLVAFAKNYGLLQTRMNHMKMVPPHKNKFWLFSNTKTNVTKTVGKEDKKMRSFV